MTRAEALQVAKPILFNTEMVRAIQGGIKTATRRIIKNQHQWNLDTLSDIGACLEPPYQIGDILYVRETWEHFDCEQCDGNALTHEPLYDDCPREGCYFYRADGVKLEGDAKWRPSIHMPKEAARIFLQVVRIWGEKLKDVTENEAISEGFSSRAEFVSAITKMYPECSAEDWFWVIEFERLEVTE